MHLRAAELAAAVEGRLHGPDVTVDGASIDSRSVRPGQLFVPVVAERNGHDFIDAALAAGAPAYLTSEAPRGGTAIVVDDTVVGLQRAGLLARGRLGGPVIGITGSVGKTSVKDLLAGVLTRRFRTAASERSFNNELGVPITLLDAPDRTEALVVEMGARGVGHIADLCAIAAPTVGIVTRVAAVHTEVFGTIDDIARAKSELVAALPFDGTAILNGDDPRVAAMASATSARVLTFGKAGDVRAEDVVLDEQLQASFLLVSDWGTTTVHLGARGEHQVGNALAAATAALVCGVALDEIAGGLGDAALSPWRMALGRAPSGATVLNDAYNANPTSVAAALQALLALPARRRVAVLGTMAELGPSSIDDHAAIGEMARRLGVRLIAVASPAYGGEDVPDTDAALAALGPLGPQDAVLVKGSRVAGLERLAARLLEG
ncbi:MAG: UDP-N-acetylmuramoyl-tripeptide--D-alanyl-D-alanine ligase [Acidimicrobiales bacterium]|nr:UDP-N-acetylmuramoyl-tripeptide--D-alanyl-D-alanine ligase [Acidimicrobiales bacterium]